MASSSFEVIARQFLAETGVMAPGKSVPDELAMCENISEEERWRLWNEWNENRLRCFKVKPLADAMLQARKDTQ